MAIEQKPFEPYKLEEDRNKRDIFTISLNQDERNWLEIIKLSWDIKSDSVALKLAAEIGKNVIFMSLPAKTWQYITREKRSRYSQFKDIQTKLDENVMQIQD